MMKADEELEWGYASVIPLYQIDCQPVVVNENVIFVTAMIDNDIP